VKRNEICRHCKTLTAAALGETLAERGDFYFTGTERELHILSLEEYVGVLLRIPPWKRRITTSHNALPCTWL